MTAEANLQALGMDLPSPPTPLGAYVEAVQTGNLLFLSGTLPPLDADHGFSGRIGGELTEAEGRRAVSLATLNALAAAREHLGSLDRVARVVRLAVSLVTTPEFRRHPTVADAASDLLARVFGGDKSSCRMVYGMTSLPAGAAAIVELILEVRSSRPPEVAHVGQ